MWLVHARITAATPTRAVRASPAGVLSPAAPEPVVPGMFTPESPLSEVELDDAADAERDAEAVALASAAVAEASKEDNAVIGVKTADVAEAERVTEDAPAAVAELALAVADPEAEPAPTYERSEIHASWKR